MHPESESDPPSQPIKLLITNVPTILQELLSGGFSALPDIHLCDPAHVAARSQNHAVDVILVGLSIGTIGPDAEALLESLSQLNPTAQLIALAEKVDCRATLALFRAGARGIVCTKGLRFDLLCKSVRCVHRGEVWANNELVGHLISSLSRPKSSDITDVHGRRLLTDREQQVLHLLAEGLSNRDLAIELKVSAHTIKNHLFRIYEKLGVSNRMEAVLYALEPRDPPPDRTSALVKPVDNIRMIKAS